MKIAIVRGDFLSSWEIPTFLPLTKNNEVTIFTGLYPVYKVEIPKVFRIIRLPCPVDINFGTISRYKMAILNRLFIDAHIMLGLERALKGYDVAYVSETYYGFTHQCLEAKKKGYIKSVVSHVSENTPFNNEGIWGKKAWKQQSIKEMNKFVAITEGARKVLIKEGCSPEKIILAKPGVDLTLFYPQKITQFRDLVKNKNIKLLFSGRLIKEKGILEIMKMFTRLYKKYTHIELIIIDRGPLVKKVREFVKKHKNSYYLGRLDYSELGKLYSLCDIYLHYSVGSKTWVEQYGFTLIESMACGLPVMGLDRGSVKEVVGDGGIVLNAQKYEKMLYKLIIDTSLRKRISQKALEFAKEKYDAEKHGQDLETIFKSTL